VKYCDIRLRVMVHDEETLLDYIREHEEEWGFPEGELSGNVAEAVFEAIILNSVCPLDIGLEIQDWTTNLREK
jgi:hypothetical protein